MDIYQIVPQMDSRTEDSLSWSYTSHKYSRSNREIILDHFVLPPSPMSPSDRQMRKTFSNLMQAKHTLTSLEGEVQHCLLRDHEPLAVGLFHSIGGATRDPESQLVGLI